MWLMSTCILTCRWNIEDGVLFPDAEPRLYSRRNDIGETTLCCKSVIYKIKNNIVYEKKTKYDLPWGLLHLFELLLKILVFKENLLKEKHE
jgi:hypothetical protein